MSIREIIEFAGVLLILIGSIMAVISAIGILRLPDVYTRSHAATKSSTLAVLLSLIGTFIYFWASEDFISVRLLLGITFVFLTAPVAGHLITRAAYRSNVKLSESSTEDALENVIARPQNTDNKSGES
ncbi:MULTISPECIES: Na+/H+ antiporter subunit G [unclassified Planococcus (in: firmicutes)]|uniref:Na+/H+ antiporter subunit G n=1 Tax=unclassified Planococcus (in: firmicutes) TaxID=2662419 RepID=UPI002080C5D8|nr:MULTISPECIES: Na+/H+ antiporter subunit G [unclassified Planococcus (in: firmicutes)]GKW45759.1 Na+/H+ antiporter subunit G [Planococcus sp. NCCP-2050]